VRDHVGIGLGVRAHGAASLIGAVVTCSATAGTSSPVADF
jgi:hypothetical protein